MEIKSAVAPPMASKSENSISTVLVCDTQPITVAGVRWTLNYRTEFLCTEAADSLVRAGAMREVANFDILIIDMTFGVRAICAFLDEIRASGAEFSSPIVWGNKISEADTGRLLRAGVKGILSRTAETGILLECLRAVVQGHVWVEDHLFRNMHCPDPPTKSLTRRETQVFELALQGLLNREIAEKLGICQGTVKIHMKNIFAKTGVRGRHSLALTSILPDDGVNPPRGHAAAA